MTTDYIPAELFLRLLDTLMPQNALVLELCMRTGMRITDALSMTLESAKSLTAAPSGLCSYRYKETKTGKERSVDIERELLERAIEQHCPGSPWLFAGRDPAKHRTRQAVWKDLNRTAKLYRIKGQHLRACVGPHTARKVFAVGLYHEALENGSEDALEAVRANLNHSDPAVTYLYALADIISERKQRVRQKKQVDKLRKVHYNEK